MKTNQEKTFEKLDAALCEHEAIWGGEPCTEEDWQSPLWEFVRRAKAIPELRDLSAVSALSIVERWLADRNLSWDSFGVDYADDDHRADFLNCWNAVRFAMGEDSLVLAFKKAERLSMELCPTTYPIESYRLFLKICWCLHEIKHHEPIALPEARLGQLLGVSARTVGTYRREAVKLKLLKVTAKHSTLARKATEFQFFPAQLRFK